MRLFISLCFTLILFAACSDDSVVFDTSDAEIVTVKTYLTRIEDSSYTRQKADTLLPSDSIILLAIIEPSRSIRIAQFYWQIDSEKTFSEFSHRALFTEPGKHTAKFILLDRFADTLSDSVEFWTAPVPILDTENFIPKNHSRNLPSNASVSFAWNATVENPLAKTVYPFTLDCDGKTLADTVLKTSQFTYKGKLPSLGRCDWQVYAQDDFQRVSKDSIQSTFYTASLSDTAAGAAYFFLDIPQEEITDQISAKIWDSAGTAISIDSLTTSWKNPVYSIRHLASGSYRIFFRHPIYKDFSSDTVEFSVSAAQITEVEHITICDTVAPHITNELASDSVPWGDTLLFSISKSGLPISKNDIRIVMDGEIITDWTFQKDSLHILTQEIQPSFIWHPLKISVKDASGNLAVRTFYVSPGRSCIETLSDTVIYKTHSIDIPIQNVCSHLTPRRFFWDIDGDGSWDGEAPAGSSNYAIKTFSGSLFYSPQNTVHVIILYESGARFETTFHIYVDGLNG